MTVTIDIGRTETIWCGQCFLSTGYRAELLILDDDGVHEIGWMTGCTKHT